MSNNWMTLVRMISAKSNTAPVIKNLNVTIEQTRLIIYLKTSIWIKMILLIQLWIN